ncbi:MAG: hypothetical protein LBC83_02145 [Oscillospiraceae bacterium]|jgi:RNA-binding protein YlmH|nr:hypothetical protein [Oscillospiraceae bacterium]
MTALLLPRLAELAQRAVQSDKPVVGSFLAPEEAAQADAVYKNRKDVRLLLDGGFVAPERAVPIFLPPGAEYMDRAAVLAALVFRFRAQDAVGHRDLLGAALGLGLERAVLGDIRIADGQAILICLRRLAPFLLENLQAAGRVGLCGCEIPLDALPETQAVLRVVRGTVASLRVDALLAEAFHASRGAAEEWLRTGLVQLNHQECKSGAKQVKPGDLLAVRGKGRCRLAEIGGESKKGRLWVSFAF